MGPNVAHLESFGVDDSIGNQRPQVCQSQDCYVLPSFIFIYFYSEYMKDKIFRLKKQCLNCLYTAKAISFISCFHRSSYSMSFIYSLCHLLHMRDIRTHN